MRYLLLIAGDTQVLEQLPPAAQSTLAQAWSHYAAELHAATGGRVLAPTGEAMVSPDGDLLSGTWRVDENHNVVPVANGDWVVFENGKARSLGTASLMEAHAILGIKTVPGGPPPTQPIGFFNVISAPQRATLNRMYYDPVPPPRTDTADSFYDALIAVAEPRITQLLGHVPTVAELRTMVAAAVQTDLAGLPL